MRNEKIEKGKYMKKFFGLLILIFILTISLLSFIAYNFLTDISYMEGFKTTPPSTTKISKKIIKIGVVSRYSPSLIYDGYQPIIDYLNENTNYYFELVLSKNYHETVSKLKNKEIDLAFLGDMVFIANRKKLNLIPVVCPVNKEGKPYLRVVLITKDDSQINNFCDLNGKKLALPSESSFSFKWGILKTKKCGIQVKIKKFNFHHTVVLQVLNGVCAAGVVREYVAEEFKEKGIKLADFSPPIPSPPLVALSSTDKQIIKEVRKKLLKFKGIKNSNRLIDKEFYYGFTIPEKSLYLKFENYLKKNGIVYEK
ncbi:phosphonate transport system substrate-binding protein [Thermotomaculum hydrothermale]|uniref:Phosphonate transport system substrate-binding protein n=1 Tax=Thermotomaculum hydrothermale TaxID=981385 RepID=A0A7R6PF95_9BACT|nr:phosphate/phosphite/phosphonate ABC transporter substrate-binding protein [Thermotomaculum hydrothermale]BBB32658.1 phosphonate transport system substrate-binding protein [Thermotomaculum hydrothermale]